MSDAKKAPNWMAIEADYRAGIKPLRQIGEEHGISHGAINKRAKRDGWTRDLKAKIVAAAEAKVSKAAVSTEVSIQRVVTETQVVEANAELQYRVRMEHRTDIARARRLFAVMLGELEVASTPEGQELIQTMQAIVNGEDDSDAGKRRAEAMRQMLDRALGLSGRAQTGKVLVDMLEKLIKMERQAFGIDDEERGGSDIDKLLAKIHAEMGE
jgi:hypothetical protein